MTTQDSLNQLEELITAERKFYKDKFATVFPDDMIDRCKRIIGKMKIPPKVYFNGENAIELVYKTESTYIIAIIHKYDYGIFMYINDVECSWAKLATAYDVVNWWNALTSMAEKMN